MRYLGLFFLAGSVLQVTEDASRCRTVAERIQADKNRVKWCNGWCRRRRSMPRDRGRKGGGWGGQNRYRVLNRRNVAWKSRVGLAERKRKKEARDVNNLTGNG